ncbi:hypothetical protein ACP70R_000374 [Stipagrostis hirtigluma subsp. patula]
MQIRRLGEARRECRGRRTRDQQRQAQAAECGQMGVATDGRGAIPSGLRERTTLAATAVIEELLGVLIVAAAPPPTPTTRGPTSRLLHSTVTVFLLLSERRCYAHATAITPLYYCNLVTMV